MSRDDLHGLRRALAERYRVLRELGVGGSATVYLADDLKHDRQVAIKVLRPELAALLGTERFLQEIALAARLRHPHLLPLFDSGVVRDPDDPAGRTFLYYVMPFVEGESLRDRLQRSGRLTVAEAVPLIQQVGSGLRYAHGQGVVHRDIKPENILLDSDQAVIADFGVARAVHHASGSRITENGMTVGTVAYMSPEQAMGEEVDARSDLYSLACVLFEMLDGEPPYQAATPRTLVAQRLTQPLRHHRTDVPVEVDTILRRALATEPGARYQSIEEFVAALGTAVAPVAVPRALWRRAWPWVAAATALLAILGVWRSSRVRAREHLVDARMPRILRAIQEGDNATAYALAVEAERIAPDHALLRELWPRIATWLSVTSEPAGAEVTYRTYADTAGPWLAAGRTPVAALRVAVGVYRFRFVRPGFDTLEVLAATPELAREVFSRQGDSLIARPDSSVHVTLVPQGESPGMVRVDVDALSAVASYTSDPITLPGRPYRIGRYEVTNEEWQRFVDAGGYQDSTLWEHPILIDDVARPWSEAMRHFTDRTGWPGPAGWEGGAYPAGQGRLPVAGISWYEAAAYARFMHQELPTIYHWFTASGWNQWGAIGPASNLEGRGPAPVGEFRAVNTFGAFDFIGNVKEWTATATDNTLRRRLTGGGSWLNPHYYSPIEAHFAWERPPDVGVRLMTGANAAAEAFAPSDRWDQVHPFGPQIYQTASEEEFRLYRDQLYAYAPAPLHDSVLAVDDGSRLWRRESVSFAAAYGGERVHAYLFIPKGAAIKPPYQVVVYWPTGIAFDVYRDSRLIGLAQGQHDYFWEFVAMSGRAVLYPIYQGSYERRRTVTAKDPNSDQTLTIQQVQDLRRAVDYLETRRDIDTTRLAFYGVSAGAFAGPIVGALEPRFKTAVFLLSVCFNDPRAVHLPPVTPMRFLPWVRLPVLSISGGNDYVLSDGRACLDRQFSLLKTPERDRRQVLYPGNHGMWGTFGYQARQEILGWLDHYLGPVGGTDTGQARPMGAGGE